MFCSRISSMPRIIRLGGASSGMWSKISSHFLMAHFPSAGPKRRSAAMAATKTAAPTMIFFRRGVQPVRHPSDGTIIVFTPLKTKRSRRIVQLPPFALERIRLHRREQLRRRTALGPRWRDPLDELGRPFPLVCDRGDGFFIYPDSFTSAFKRFAGEAGLHPATRLHDVRHAVATELGRRGVHPVIVSVVLGHASPPSPCTSTRGRRDRPRRLPRSRRRWGPSRVGNPLAHEVARAPGTSARA